MSREKLNNEFLHILGNGTFLINGCERVEVLSSWEESWFLWLRMRETCGKIGWIFRCRILIDLAASSSCAAAKTSSKYKNFSNSLLDIKPPLEIFSFHYYSSSLCGIQSAAAQEKKSLNLKWISIPMNYFCMPKNIKWTGNIATQCVSSPMISFFCCVFCCWQIIQF